MCLVVPNPLPTGPPMHSRFPDLLGVLFLFAGLSCYTQPHSNEDHVQIERSLVLRRVLATEAVCHASKDPHRLQSLPTGHEKWVPHRDLLF